MKEIIVKARELALDEIDKTSFPSLLNFNTSYDKGQELARKLKANKEIIALGTILMDIKLGECLKENKLNEHIDRSVETTKKFLEQFSLDDEIKKKVINCVAGHHRTIEWTCLEAEICANSDCYRFLLTKNWLIHLNHLNKNGNLEEALTKAEEKLEEKWKILSLNKCKKELQPHYKLIKKLIEKARKN